MSARRNASNQAAEYAEKKRQQMERAQQLKEERKANIMRVAQNDIVGGTSTGGFSNGNHSYVRQHTYKESIERREQPGLRRNGHGRRARIRSQRK